MSWVFCTFDGASVRGGWGEGDGVGDEEGCGGEWERVVTIVCTLEKG